MGQTLRGADIVARSLERLGCGRVFTLSGNHIMSIFDAAIEAGLDLVHVRHEAAAVHMADAHGRLTGEPGIALVTGGPGHANAVGALFTALGAESPMVLLSGHAATWELGPRRISGIAPGRDGGAGHQGVVDGEGRRLARPRHRRGGPHRHVGAAGAGACEPAVRPARCEDQRKRGRLAATQCRHAHAASAPIADDRSSPPSPARSGRSIIAGPQMSNVAGRALLARLEAATGAPAVIMESPRGIADATLGAFPDLIAACRPDRAARQGARLHHQMGRRAGVRSGCAGHRHRSRRGAGRTRRAKRKASAC